MEFEDLEKAYEIAEELKNNYENLPAEICHNIGVVYILKKEYEKAYSMFKKAVESNLLSDETLYYFAVSLFNTKKFNELMKIKIPKKNHYKVEVMLFKIKAALNLKDKDKALSMIKELQSMGIESQELNLLLLRALNL